jgi:hypothetical protein
MAVHNFDKDLLQVGKVETPHHCKRVADYFGKPYYVSIPTESDNLASSEYMCYVGGNHHSAAAKKKKVINTNTNTNNENNNNKKCCSCNHPVGYLALLSPMPVDTYNTGGAHVKAPPSMLSLYAAARSQPWELRKRFTYYTEIEVDGQRVTVPVWRGGYDCMRIGCEELSNKDHVEVRNVLGHRYIAYEANLYV